MSKLVVGQQLWWVPFQKYLGEPHYVSVLSVGRKWAELDNHKRIRIEDLYADGGQYSSPGRCYLSQDDYTQSVVRQRLYRDLHNRMDYSAGEGVSIDNIKEAARLLGIELKD